MKRAFLLPLLSAIAVTLCPPAAAEVYRTISPPNVAGCYGGAQAVPLNAYKDMRKTETPTLGAYLIPWSGGQGTSTTHYLEAGDFGGATGYTEGNDTYGYVGSDLKINVKYRITNSAFTGGETLQGAWTSGGTEAAKEWTLWTFDPPFDVSSNIGVTPASGWPTGTSNTFSQRMPAAAVAHFNSWYKINRNKRADATIPGLDFRLWWDHPAGQCTNARVYVDYIYLGVCGKLHVFNGKHTYTDETGTFGGVTVTEGTKKVPLLYIRMRRGYNTTIKINSLLASLEGTGLTPACITALHLYRDTTLDHAFTSADLVYKTVNAPSSLTDIAFTGAPLVTVGAVTNASSRFYVVADIADDACSAISEVYLGARLAGPEKIVLNGTIDKVVTQADRDEPTVVDTKYPRNLWPIRTGDTDDKRVRIVKRANVTATVSFPDGPSTAMGQNFTVRVTCTNAAGCGTAVNVVPLLPLRLTAVSGSPAASYVSGTATGVTLAAGASYSWDFVYKANMDGVCTFAARAQYNDQYNYVTHPYGSSGTTYTSAYGAESEPLTIDPTPMPILQFTELSLTPANITSAGTLTLTATVKNAGTLGADNVGLYHPDTNALFSFRESGTAAGSLDYGSPAVQTLAPGASYTWTFTWTPTPGTTGTKWFDLYAKCDNDPATEPGTTNTANVVVPGDLVADAFFATPGTKCGFGSTFNLTLRVRNVTGATMNNVTPSTPTFTASAGSGNNPFPLPAIASGPLPASATLAAGESVDFTWVVNSNCNTRLGFVDIGGGKASGVDSIFGTTDDTGAALTIPLYQIDDSLAPRFVAATTSAVRVPITYSDDSQYYALDEGGILYACSTTGVIKWTQPLGVAANATHLLNLWVDNVGGQNVVFAGSAAGRVYGIVDTGGAAGPLWGASVANSYYAITGNPAVHGIVAYSEPPDYDPYLLVTAGTKILKLRMVDKTLVWLTDAGATLKSAPSVDNNYCYVGTSNGTIMSFLWEDGTLVDETAPFVGLAQQVTSPFPAGNTLYASTSLGYVVKVGNALTLDGCSELLVAPANTRTLSDVWLSMDAKTLWCTRAGTPGTNMNLLYKINVTGATPAWAAGWTGGKDFASVYGPAPDSLSPPIEFDGRVYLASYASAGAQKGRVWILNAADGTRFSDSYPYTCETVGSRFQTPAALDLVNGLFLLGCDDLNIYFFSVP